MQSRGRLFWERNPSYGHLICGSLLLFIVLAFFRDYLSPNNLKVLSSADFDMPLYFLPWKEFVFSRLRQGQMPFWNPYSYGGVPCLANIEIAPFYPLNWIFCSAPIQNAVNWTIVLHVFLTGLFFYFWLAYRNLHPLACLFGASVFMFGGSFFFTFRQVIFRIYVR